MKITLNISPEAMTELFAPLEHLKKPAKENP
jgi:hypothetical protein